MRCRAAPLVVFAATLVLSLAGGAAAAPLPRGLPRHAPAAATGRQPTLPEPAQSAWPFSDAFSHTSGSGRLAGGAELWSDFIFDDHGAAIPAAVPLEPLEASSILALWQGDYGYTNRTARNNGADIFRAGVAIDRSSTYWRVDWSTLADPKVPIAEWAVDTDDNAATGGSVWPAGAGVRSAGIDRALLVSTRGAWLIDPRTGKRVDVRARGGALMVDRSSQSFIVRIPRSLLPVNGAWRLRLVSGLANPAGHAFGPATLVGGGPVPPGYPNVYNVAFRAAAQEPPIYADGLTDALEVAMGKLIAATPVLGSTYGLDGQERAVTGNFWSEDDQADTLNSGDVSKFSLVIHWSDLEHRLRTREPLPRGYSVRWYVSRFKLGGGLASGEALQSSPSGSSYNEIPQLLSRVQPYAVYVPHDYSPRHPTALTWTLHSLETDYGQYAGLDPRLIEQLCEERSSICGSPEGLGPSGDWAGMAESDLWQVWRAVADTYNIDPARTVLSGYSMGGEASNTLAAEHPDLFAGGLVLDGSTFAPIPISNLRWIPYVIDNTIADELDPTTDALKEADQFDSLGQRYTLLLHTGGDHITFAIEDRFDDAVKALGEPRRASDPGQFSYAWNPSYDSAKDGIGATGDYWLDDLTARDAKATARITADDQAVPHPVITDVRHGLTPVSSPTPGFSQSLSWRLGATPAAKPMASLSLDSVAGVAINTKLARLRGGTITVKSDGATMLTLEYLPTGTTITEGGRTLERARRRGDVRVRLSEGAHVLRILPAPVAH
jgi:dienelactone hydrolase